MRGNITAIINEYKRAYKSGATDGTPWFPAFHEATGELSKASDALLEDITETARKVRYTPHGRLPSFRVSERYVGPFLTLPSY